MIVAKMWVCDYVIRTNENSLAKIDLTSKSVENDQTTDGMLDGDFRASRLYSD